MNGNDPAAANTPDPWERIAVLFEAIQELSPDEQRAYLDRHCDDPHVRKEVESLLGEHAAADEFLEEPTHLQDLEATAVTGFGEVSVDQIGSYRVLAKLGEGGMGVVYRVEQENPRRIAALKVIRPGYATSEMLRRFEHEAQLLGRLQHDGIARIYEAGTADLGFGPQPFFAMEYVDGPTLTEYTRKQQLTTDQRLELLARICDAVQHAHEKGVIHRDLKPGNILIAEGGQPKILDFGVARATDSDIQVTTLQTTPGQVIGTLQYMSPEQASGDPEQLDVSSDVYSLGVIGYELLSGQLPHDLGGRMIHEAVRIVVEDDPQPLSQISTIHRGDVDTIVGKAMAREKTRRYRTALEFASDIRRYLKNEPIQARPPSSLYYLRKFAQRHRGLTASILIVFLLICAFAVQKAIDNQRLTATNDRLEERFREVRAMAQHFVRFDAEIRNLVGATKARQSLVETARDFLSKIALEKEDDRDLQLEMAEAYQLVGDVLADPTQPNLGETAAALECYGAGLHILQRLHGASGATRDIALQESLARAHRKVGMLQALRGEYDLAAAEYQSAWTALKVVGLDVGEVRIQGEIAQLHRREGALGVRRKNFEAAVAAYAASGATLREQLQPLLQQDEPRLNALLEQYEVDIEQIEAERRGGMKKIPEAIAGLQAVREKLEGLGAKHARNARLGRGLVRCLDKLGWNHLRVRSYAGSEESFQAAMQERRR
ncbi:MAG: serine/threonine-protein kinase, partial [Planctomycetota bacterium]